MVLVGFIPGPKEPKDLDSFLYPLVQEFKALAHGIPGVFNAARQETPQATFLMRAYIVTVGADMIGRSKVNPCSNSPEITVAESILKDTRCSL